ncbi:hypothetical protein HK096_006142, partial [Nowakowskiella sp. JEL0078]
MIRYAGSSKILEIFETNESDSDTSGNFINLKSRHELGSETTCFAWIANYLSSYGIDVKHQSDNSFPVIDLTELKGELGDELIKTEVNSQNLNQIIPFDFLCGMVGYFGYEMKQESLQISKESSLNAMDHNFRMNSAISTPDASFIFTDRVLVFDNFKKEIYAVVLQKSDKMSFGNSLNEKWALDILGKVRSDAQLTTNRNSFPSKKLFQSDETNRIEKSSKVKIEHPRSSYISNVQKCLDNIREGETYEMCLTTQIKLSGQRLLKQNLNPSSLPWEFYKLLRQRNPAPYGSFIDFGAILQYPDSQYNWPLAIASSSPELFLKVNRSGSLSMKPIKGTIARNLETPEEDEKRAKWLQNNEKDQAENLMIESFATVHQLVSTVCGQLRADLTHVDAVMRSFPP